MQDRPTDAELLGIVADTLRTAVIPELTGPAAYKARIAASLVAMVARALVRGHGAEREEAERLRALLDRDGGDLASLNRELAARIRDGGVAEDDPLLLIHLWRTTLDKLAIDQPTYPRYTTVANGAQAY
jgi:hypothetical protein